MEKPKVIKCPDGHFRRAIFSLGPYIADYPEQVWLTGVVSNWCPKYVLLCNVTMTVGIAALIQLDWTFRCDALPSNLDGDGSHCRSHEKTDFIVKNFNPRALWDEFGIRHDIVVRHMRLIFLQHSDSDTHSFFSHLPTHSHVQTSINSSPLISCTN
jgi:hypothetical protein